MGFEPAAWAAREGLASASHPAAPESPEETNTEMPSAAAALNNVSQNWTADCPYDASQPPKLMLMICAGTGLVSTAYSVAIPSPSAPPASELTIRSTVAPGAMLVVRVTSRVASTWSPGAGLTVPSAGPGSVPNGGMITVGSFTGRDDIVSKLSMSGL